MITKLFITPDSPEDQTIESFENLNWMRFGRILSQDVIKTRTEEIRQELRKEVALKESYSALLWLYRRLPRCYESPPHIEAAIKNLAKALGEDAQEFIDERKGMK